MMCAHNSVIGSLWFSTGEAQETAELAGAGVLDLSVFEHQVFPVENLNEELDNLLERHGGFTSFIAAPRPRPA
jgi:alcohol dehydrogenase